jgi:hypothetical protein
MYEHSLGLAFILLFLLPWIGQRVRFPGRAAANRDAAATRMAAENHRP